MSQSQPEAKPEFAPRSSWCIICTERLRCPGCVPQRKKSMSICDGSSCPHLDGILGRALNPQPINIKNEHLQQSDHMVPGSLRLQETLQRRLHPRLAYVTHKRDVPSQISMSFSNYDLFLEWKESKWTMRGERFHYFPFRKSRTI